MIQGIYPCTRLRAYAATKLAGTAAPAAWGVGCRQGKQKAARW
jgi:hypothetical protein